MPSRTSPARWQSGQINIDGEWLAVGKAQAEAAADPTLAEYKRMRSSAEDSLAGQLALARWCRKHGLREEARFHWMTVLSFDPENGEALRALDSRWYGGRLMTRSQIELAKAQAGELRESAKKFRPQVGRWDRLLVAGDIKSRDQALTEIAAIRDVNAIAALEEFTLGVRPTTNAKFERSLAVSQAVIRAHRRNAAAGGDEFAPAPCDQLAVQEYP